MLGTIVVPTRNPKPQTLPARPGVRGGGVSGFGFRTQNSHEALHLDMCYRRDYGDEGLGCRTSGIRFRKVLRFSRFGCPTDFEQCWHCHSCGLSFPTLVPDPWVVPPYGFLEITQ